MTEFSDDDRTALASTGTSSLYVQTRISRFILGVVICVLHLWAFFWHQSTVQPPKDTTRRYIEIWNVFRPIVPPTASLRQEPTRSHPTRIRSGSAPLVTQERPAHHLRQTPSQVDSSSLRYNDSQLSDKPEGSKTQGTSGTLSSVLAPDRPTDRHLDMNLLRKLARDDEKQRIKSPLEQVREHEHINRSIEAQVANAAERGARKDCQTAYSSGSAGILALVPLLYGTLTDDGCKWK